MSDAAIAEVGLAPPEPATTGARHHARELLRNPSGLIGVILVAIPVVLTVLAVTGLLPADPSDQDPPARLQDPSFAHLFGTDQFGRDVFSRVAAGVSNSAQIALLAVGLSAFAGTLAGLVAGFFRGVADSVVGGVANVLFAFPPLLLALSLASVLDRNRFTVALAIAVVYVPIFTRVVRGPVLTLREVEFVKAATSTGQRRLLVLFRHVLPNVGPLIIIQVTLSLSWAVLTEAALSYLGLGAPPPAPSLGAMIFEARTLMYRAPWTMIAPGAVVVVVVVSLNLLGDALRDVFDPRSRGRA